MANRSYFRSNPDVTSVYTFNPAGVQVGRTDYLTAVSFEQYSNSGYVGPFPKQKPLPPHAYSMDTQKLHGITWLYEYQQSASTNRTFGQGSMAGRGQNLFWTEPVIDFTQCYNEAVEKLHEKTRGSLDLSVDIAEYHQTAKMLHVTEKLKDYTVTFFKKSPFRAAANLWLEYTYGVKPLLSSIYGAADESVRVVINRSERYTAKGRDFYSPTVFHFVRGVFGTAAEVLPIVNPKFPMVTKLSVDIRTDQWDVNRWSSLNPVSIAWELLPYSFVADWVYNVGGYLRGMETALLYANRFRSGTRTDFSEGSAQLSYVKTSQPGALLYRNVISGSYSAATMKRTLLTSYPRPYLPMLKVNLGSSRLFSAAALLRQHIKDVRVR